MKIEIGKIVWLNTSSPSMSIKSYNEYGIVTCQWFDGTTLHEGGFAEESLVEKNPNPPKDTIDYSK